MSVWKEWFGRKSSRASKEERRREKRLRTTQDYIIEFVNERFKEKKVAVGRDLSVEGVRFATPLKLKRGEFLDLTLHFSKAYQGSRSLRLKAGVVHLYRPSGSRRYRVGCHLVHENPKTKDHLREFLAWAETHSS